MIEGYSICECPAVGNARLCVATPYWASEVLRAVMQKGCAACAGTAREANGRRLARPTQSNRRRPSLCLAVAATSMGRFGVAKDSSAIACATCTETQGSSSSTRPLELPSGATLCPDEADVALARATGLQEWRKRGVGGGLAGPFSLPTARTLVY